MNAFWGGMGNKPAQSGGDKFDSFASFFPASTPTQQRPETKPSNDMYDYFFTDNSHGDKPQPSNPPQANTSNQGNLLDL